MSRRHCSEIRFLKGALYAWSTNDFIARFPVRPKIWLSQKPNLPRNWRDRGLDRTPSSKQSAKAFFNSLTRFSVFAKRHRPSFEWEWSICTPNTETTWEKLTCLAPSFAYTQPVRPKISSAAAPALDDTLGGDMHQKSSKYDVHINNPDTHPKYHRLYAALRKWFTEAVAPNGRHLSWNNEGHCVSGQYTLSTAWRNASSAKGNCLYADFKSKVRDHKELGFEDASDRENHAQRRAPTRSTVWSVIFSEQDTVELTLDSEKSSIGLIFRDPSSSSPWATPKRLETETSGGKDSWEPGSGPSNHPLDLSSSVFSHIFSST